MPPEGTDLSNAVLTQSQRLWLGRVVLIGLYNIRDLADKWNMKYKQVQKYSYRLQRGRIPAEKGGRPKLLDAEGTAEFMAAFVNQGIRDREVLKTCIDRAYTSSYKRRRSVIEDVEDVELEMQRRTRNRYIAQIFRETGTSEQTAD